MRSPSSAFQTSLAADAIPFAWIVEFQATTYIRYAFWPQDITFNSNVYSANGGKVSKIEENLEAQAPRCTLVIQNQDRTIRDWLKASDRRGTVVALRVVMTDDLSDSTSVIEELFEIDSYSWDADEATIELGASPVLGGLQVPSRKAQTHFCPWDYKGAECGYVGRLPTCDFTYDGPNGCRKHFGLTDAKRFGGFIGAPSRELVL